MIELDVPAPSGPGARLVLRPRRALSAGQFRGFFGLLATVMGLVAAYAYSQGNVFAPAFAVLDAAIVAAALRWVWRQGERFEVIALDERTLEVRRSAQAEPAFRAHPYWVRLELAGAGDGHRVRLGSQGRQVEVGAFLSPEERLDLAGRLKDLLAAASGRRRDQDTTLG